MSEISEALITVLKSNWIKKSVLLSECLSYPDSELMGFYCRFTRVFGSMRVIAHVKQKGLVIMLTFEIERKDQSHDLS